MWSSCNICMLRFSTSKLSVIRRDPWLISDMDTTRLLKPKYAVNLRGFTPSLWSKCQTYKGVGWSESCKPFGADDSLLSLYAIWIRSNLPHACWTRSSNFNRWVTTASLDFSEFWLCDFVRNQTAVSFTGLDVIQFRFIILFLSHSWTT